MTDQTGRMMERIALSVALSDGRVVALCADGSLWTLDLNRPQTDWRWCPLPSVPQPDWAPGRVSGGTGGTVNVNG